MRKSETDIFDSKVGEILAIAIWAFAKIFYFVFATFANSVYYGSKFLSKFKNMKVFKQVKKRKENL